jgi:hypothetical protein
MSAEPFSFRDIWAPLAQIIDEFGIERCTWGTDWVRTSQLLNYRQGLHTFRATGRLSADDKAMLLGGSAARPVDGRRGENETLTFVGTAAGRRINCALMDYGAGRSLLIPDPYSNLKRDPAVPTLEVGVKAHS